MTPENAVAPAELQSESEIKERKRNAAGWYLKSHLPTRSEHHRVLERAGRHWPTLHGSQWPLTAGRRWPNTMEVKGGYQRRMAGKQSTSIRMCSPSLCWRDELTIQDELIFKGQQIVAPVVTRKELMEKMHASHIGIEGCLRWARETMTGRVWLRSWEIHFQVQCLFIPSQWSRTGANAITQVLCRPVG